MLKHRGAKIDTKHIVQLTIGERILDVRSRHYRFTTIIAEKAGL